jgi:hydroxymethylbilane synthase
LLIIGSRGSQLALWQARHVQALLAARGFEARIEIIHTTGDKITDVSLARLGQQTSTKGLFTKELEDALLDGRVHLAVHSLKDMPTELPPGLVLAAVPAREDVRDALIGRTLAELAEGAHVGTSALRRQAQLHALRPDLKISPIRGNLDTRLRKLDEGQYDAIVLAAAGLKRLGWQERVAEFLGPDRMVPAVGQGALAIETAANSEALEAVRMLEDPAARAAVTAERAVLAHLGGGCQVPIGAHARLDGDTLHLIAVVISPDGRQVIRRESAGPVQEAQAIGEAMARELLTSGGRRILVEVYSKPLLNRRVLITRATSQAGSFRARLESLGAEVMEFPVIAVYPPKDPAPLEQAVEAASSYDWIIFTSANAAAAFFPRLKPGQEGKARICAVGPATKAAVEAYGRTVALMPEEFVGEGVAAAFAAHDLANRRVLLPRAAVARDVVPDALRALGAQVDVVEAYRTGLPDPAPVLPAGPVDWITFTSSSTVKNFLALGGATLLDRAKVASIGPITSDTLRMHGVRIDVEAAESTTDALAQAMAAAEA